MSIEGMSAIINLEGLRNGRLVFAFLLFFVSLLLTFSPTRSSDVASGILAFSYSSFLILVFAPPAHLLFNSLEPRLAILIDLVFSFCEAMLVCYIVIGALATELSKTKKSSYIVTAASFTVAGIYFLFSSL
jgi:hypothetical protein